MTLAVPSLRRRLARALLRAAVLLGVVVPTLRPSVAEAAQAGQGTGRLVVELKPGASKSLVLTLLSAQSWVVSATGRTTSAATGLGDLLLVAPSGLLASARSAVETALEALPTVERVEQEVVVAIGGRYGGEQSHMPVFVDELNLASMRHQPAFLGSGLEPPESPSGNPAVRVAVLDGGFDLGHEALAGRTAAGWDAISMDADPQDLGNGVDDDGDGDADSGVGHGTAVASVVAVAAPEAVVVPVRILDDEGFGTTFALAEGLRFALDAGVPVVNVSAGSPVSSEVVEAALDRAHDLGVLVVASAGNTGDSNPTYPGSSAHVLSVTGVTDEGTRDPDASVGAAVDLAAPSVEVVAPFPGLSDGYGHWFGTSFSAALVSAAAARVLQADPGPGVAAGTALLGCAAAFPPEAAPWDSLMGEGILDASPLLEP
jgi:hypothetical protein